MYTDPQVVSVTLSERACVQLPHVRLAASDRDIALRLKEAGRLDLTELHDGTLQVETRGWIGVVRLHRCTIHVEPRLIDGHRVLIQLLDYVSGLDLMKQLPIETRFEAEGRDLFDLMAWLLAITSDSVLRLGVQADYLPQHDELTALRGRLDVRSQVLLTVWATRSAGLRFRRAPARYSGESLACPRATRGATRREQRARCGFRQTHDIGMGRALSG
jgi:hypothetical protein